MGLNRSRTKARWPQTGTGSPHQRAPSRPVVQLGSRWSPPKAFNEVTGQSPKRLDVVAREGPPAPPTPTEVIR